MQLSSFSLTAAAVAAVAAAAAAAAAAVVLRYSSGGGGGGSSRAEVVPWYSSPGASLAAVGSDRPASGTDQHQGLA